MVNGRQAPALRRPILTAAPAVLEQKDGPTVHPADGTPALATRKQQLAWREVMRTEFASLRAAEETGIPTLLDTYGATNAAEFFAVSTEAFFERPLRLRSQHPRLYSELQNYFRQDPVQFSAERTKTG